MSAEELSPTNEARLAEWIYNLTVYGTPPQDRHIARFRQTLLEEQALEAERKRFRESRRVELVCRCGTILFAQAVYEGRPPPIRRCGRCGRQGAVSVLKMPGRLVVVRQLSPEPGEGMVTLAES